MSKSWFLNTSHQKEPGFLGEKTNSTAGQRKYKMSLKYLFGQKNNKKKLLKMMGIGQKNTGASLKDQIRSTLHMLDKNWKQFKCPSTLDWINCDIFIQWNSYYTVI